MSPPPNRYPVGSIAVCRFAFTLRPLTLAENAAFINGQGLPSGVGSSPQVVLFNYWPPNQTASTQLTTSSTPPIVQDGVGAYHVNLPVTLPGQWYYKGVAQDGSGNPLGATRRFFFFADP